MGSLREKPLHTSKYTEDRVFLAIIIGEMPEWLNGIPSGKTVTLYTEDSGFFSSYLIYGEMPEWLNGTVSKTVDSNFGSQGSNPCLSAINGQPFYKQLLLLRQFFFGFIEPVPFKNGDCNREGSYLSSKTY
jgi:hypothetical protein